MGLKYSICFDFWLLDCENRLVYLVKNFSIFASPKEFFRLKISPLDIKIGFEEFTKFWQKKLFPPTKDFNTFVLLVMFVLENVRLINKPIWITSKFPLKYRDLSLEFRPLGIGFKMVN